MAEAEKHAMKKYLLLLVAILALGAGVYFSELRFLSSSRPNASATPVAAQGDTLAALDATSTKSAGVNFTLSVGGEVYSDTVHDGATVIDAMNTLASGGSFRFTSKDFPGIGAFVESINGQRNTNGFYWILYVNGTSSPTGASQTLVHANDSLEWRYEKGY